MLSSLRRLAGIALRAAVYPAFETLWTALFRVARGRIAPQDSALWSSPGGCRVLIIGAHPDDETLGCGGVALLHRHAGDEVHIFVLTDGGNSRGPGLPRDKVVALRAAEMQGAAGLLGVECDQWALPEMAWEVTEAVDRLDRLLATWRPDVIYSHSLVDYHPEHRKAAAALAQALETYGDSTVIRCFEAGVPLLSLANVVAPIGPVYIRKRGALAAFASQRDVANLERRRSRYNAALFGQRGPTEVFWQLDAATFAALMQQPPGPPYRGLRERPLTDPLAYFDGERRQQFRNENGDAMSRQLTAHSS